MNDQNLVAPKGSGMAMLVYILYMVGIVFALISLIGVIIAYINKSDAPHWLKSHYQFQIRTFWIGILFGLVGLLLTVIYIGWLLIFLSVIWLVIRCVKGFKYLDSNSAVPNPKTWLF